MTSYDYEKIKVLLDGAASKFQSDIPARVRVALQVILTYSSGAPYDAALPIVLRYLRGPTVNVDASVGPFESGKVL